MMFVHTGLTNKTCFCVFYLVFFRVHFFPPFSVPCTVGTHAAIVDSFSFGDDFCALLAGV